MTDALTDEELAELRTREACATNGPWRMVDRAGDGQSPIYVAQCNGPVVAEDMREADAMFLAYVRNKLPALLAEVERLRAELKEESERYERSTDDFNELWSGVQLALGFKYGPGDGGVSVGYMVACVETTVAKCEKHEQRAARLEARLALETAALEQSCKAPLDGLPTPREARLEAMARTLIHDIDAAESYEANRGSGGQTTNGSAPRLHSCRAGALIYLRQLVRDVDPELAKGGT